MHKFNEKLLGVGFRYSPYGPAYNPGAEYWASVGIEMVKRFPGSRPEGIWIVSRLAGEGTLLTFPGNKNYPQIIFSQDDANQAALDLFDKLDFRVWLQVEPGKANVETLIDLVLTNYGSHACVEGIGVDVEWHFSTAEAKGMPVTDDQAASWLETARKHNPGYRLFLKHWETSMLPPRNRDNMLFVDDSQMFNSLSDMLLEFSDWGRYFSPAPVAFQIGYTADKKWWSKYPNPAKSIGEAILQMVPNSEGLYWVDFTALDVFPP